MILAAATALAAPISCDPQAAHDLLVEARIDEERVPVTHPWLVPGLALASEHTDQALREALTAWCAKGGELSLGRAEHWAAGSWSATTLLLSRGTQEGCALTDETLAVTIGVGDDGPRYGLRGRLPVGRTPVGSCDLSARFREERVLDGSDGPVRLVLAIDHDGERRVASRVLVRRATPDGWTEHTLAEPAPDRLLDGGDGPTFTLATLRSGEIWVVRSGDRAGRPCRPVPGQQVWTWTGHGWTSHTGREALTLLAREGLWRQAGEEGWFLVLAQDDEDDAHLLEPRMRRLQRRDPEPLSMWRSSDFPGLNGGYVFVAPAPWPDRASAEAAYGRWRRRGGTYVKRGWEAVDACADAPTQADQEPSPP